MFVAAVLHMRYNVFQKGMSKMQAGGIRMPRQKRSMEKKEAIIQAGYRLFCSKGYYKTNTAEIAQAAGVSTGIIYNYFCDKKDILKEAVGLYILSLEQRLDSIWSGSVSRENLPELVGRLFDALAASHTMDASAHDEFLALALLEPEIRDAFSDFERRLMGRARDRLAASGFSQPYLEEKLRISFGIMEQVCHDYIRLKIDRAQMKRERLIAVNTIAALLNEEGGKA